VNILIEVALDFVGRVVNGTSGSIRTNDLGLNVIVARAGRQILGKGGAVSYLIVADTAWIVTVHPSAAVADIRRS
jgi:hypothetical protein